MGFHLVSSDGKHFPVGRDIINRSKYMSKALSGNFIEKYELKFDRIDGNSMQLVIDFLQNDYTLLEELDIGNIFSFMDILEFLGIDISNKYWHLIRIRLLSIYPLGYKIITRRDPFIDVIIYSKKEALETLISSEYVKDINVFNKPKAYYNFVNGNTKTDIEESNIFSVKSPFVNFANEKITIYDNPLILAVSIYALSLRESKNIQDSYDIVKLLLHHGADPNISVNMNRINPLSSLLSYKYVIMPNEDMVKLLLKNGAIPNSLLLEKAINNNDPMYVKALIENSRIKLSDKIIADINNLVNNLIPNELNKRKDRNYKQYLKDCIPIWNYILNILR